MSWRYVDRRDKYGLTFLSGKRAHRVFIDEAENPLSSLISSGQLADLTELKIIQSFVLKKFKHLPFSVLSQKKIFPVILPSEWSVGMFVKAAQVILRAENYLVTKNMTVDDAHPWNVMFEQDEAFLTDMGAMNFSGTDVHWDTKKHFWPAYPMFKGLMINPIFLLLGGRASLVRKRLQDYAPFSNAETLFYLLKKPSLACLFMLNALMVSICNFLYRLFPSKDFLKVYLSVESFTLNALASKLEAKESAPLPEGISGTLLELLRPEKEVLVYANSTEPIHLLSKKFQGQIVFLTEDDGILEMSWPKNVSKSHFDFRSPTPGVGPLNLWGEAALKRFRSEQGILILDLEDLVIRKSMTVREVFLTARSLIISSAALYLSYGMKENLKGRNYGQLEEKAILALATQVFALHEVQRLSEDSLIILVGNK